MGKHFATAGIARDATPPSMKNLNRPMIFPDASQIGLDSAASRGKNPALKKY
jgi:hypothetical protein